MSHTHFLLVYTSFFYYLFVCLPHGSCRERYFTQREKKIKPMSHEKQQMSLRKSLITCNSSLWSLAASQPLKYMKHPCILINSPFGLASSCIFLLVVIRKVLTNSSKAQKGIGPACMEGVRRQESFWAQDTWHTYGTPQAGLGQSVGSNNSLRTHKMCPLEDLGRAVEVMISTLGVLPRAGLLKV